ncbi:MAG: hypothetical protein WEE03_06945 [Chloroflexota bacterium]
MPDPDPTVDVGLAAFARGDMERAVSILGDAVERFQPGGAPRAELLQRLGSALARTGQFERADAALTESVDLASASGDEGLVLRSTIERMTWRLQSRRASQEEAQALGESALPLLEQLGDELGLAKAWHLLGNEYVAASSAAGVEALERALTHARRAGDQREIGDILWWLGVAYHFGPMPADEAIGRCEAMLELSRMDRSVEAGTLGMLAGLNAMRGNFAEARDLFGRSLAILDSLGMRLRMATRRTISGGIELLADDPVAAERELRWGYQRLEEMGQRADLGPLAAQLCEALYRQGRYEEAELYANDPALAASRSLRAIRAKLAARRGDGEAAEGLAREVVSGTDRTDDINRQGDARVALAEVLALRGHAGEARATFEEALARYDAKGNVAARGRVVSLMDLLA